jgi:hypothetical protein
MLLADRPAMTLPAVGTLPTARSASRRTIRPPEPIWAMTGFAIHALEDVTAAGRLLPTRGCGATSRPLARLDRPLRSSGFRPGQSRTPITVCV